MSSHIYAQSMRRVFRPAVLFAGLLAYVLFTWTLLRSGQLHVSESAFQLLIPVWVAGFVLLMLKPLGLQRVGEGHIVLARSIWCNVGAVALAVLVPHTLRLLLLVVPLFSVLYASVHLVGRQVVLVVLATAAVYCLAVLYLLTSNRVDAEFEVLCGLAFALLLGGALLLAAEMQNLRDGLVARNRGLRDAMERLHDMALKDELTGLHNRRSILDVLNRQKALADRGQQAFTLCYCDLDHFKVVNDRYGHAVGDVALRQFAELADAVVRNVDYAARFGGEEFLLVLVDADEDTAYRVSQRLAERTREMWVPGTDPGSVMTVSVGIARYRSGEQVDGVLSRADRALYAAKRAGRDCVQVAEIGT